jgi:hypothetical protein
MTFDFNSPEFEFLCSRMEKGDVVLFCGAGFSFDAINLNGQKPPLGKALGGSLANLAKLPYFDEPLPLVYQAARKHLGTLSLNAWLKREYTIKSFADWYKIVGAMVWHRIYTTNIDDLLNNIFRGRTIQTLDTIVCPAPPTERDPHFKTVQCVHLHGHVNQLEKGLTFTLQEFAQQQAKPNPWYQSRACTDFCVRGEGYVICWLMAEGGFQT